MATTSDRPRKRRDRLERFFKRSANPANTLQGPAAQGPVPVGHSALEQFMFPEPPFRRPRSTRMLARDELALASSPACPSQSASQRHSTGSSTAVSLQTSVTSILDDFPGIPPHGLSLPRKSTRHSFVTFLDHTFSSSLRMSVNSSTSPTGSLIKIGSCSRSGPGSIPPASNVQPDVKLEAFGSKPRSTTQAFPPDTPPPSAQDESFPSPPTTPNRLKTLPSISPPTNPTPEPSPKLSLARTSSLPELEVDEVRLDRPITVDRPKSLDGSTTTTPPFPCLRRSASESTLLASLILQIENVLKEPSLADFLALSDDDIADGSPVKVPTEAMVPKPLSCAQPPALSYSRPPSPFNDGFKLSLLHPLAIKPAAAAAAAAAFEAARIAMKYQFDFVYVVGLWPRRVRALEPAKGATSPSTPLDPSLFLPNHSLSSPPHQDIDRSTPEDICDKGLTGRLLAAYGLHSMGRPFSIDTRVHRKVLETDGWLEYRCEAPLEFSRGYTCSFYTVRTSPTGHPTVINKAKGQCLLKEDTEQKPQTKPNRGIVFAAYRLPQSDGTNISTDAAELEVLRHEAGQLVDMLIDLYAKAKSRKNARLGHGSTRAKTRSTDTVVLAI